MIAISDRVDTVAHVIQIALTPVFLFSGIASLLGVLSTRLGRVADHVDSLSEKLESADARERARRSTELLYLRRRTLILDFAVILATLGGAMTLGAGLLLFLGGLRERTGASLFVVFGLALVATICALMCFLVEMLLSSCGIRSEAAAKSAENDEPADAADDAEPSTS